MVRVVVPVVKILAGAAQDLLELPSTRYSPVEQRVALDPRFANRVDQVVASSEYQRVFTIGGDLAAELRIGNGIGIGECGFFFDDDGTCGCEAGDSQQRDADS